MRLRFCLRTLFLCVPASLAVATPAFGQDLRTAEQDLLQGRADQAIAGLESMLARSPGNADAHLLLCRALLSELHGEEAAQHCQLALDSGLDHNSAAQDWAGRAFGMQAEHAGPIAGLKLAARVRSAFQAAYDLNHRNPAAANDLGEYFVNAPFLVGGGFGKASALADQLQSSLPEIAHRLRALLAEKRGDPAQAEREFQAATQIAAAPGSFVDLACFYIRQHQPAKAAVTARKAIALDRALDANVVDAASALNDVQQAAEAAQTLQAYLARGQKSDQAPSFRVHTLLGAIFASKGDRTNARREFETALTFASTYAPARKGLASL